MPAGRAAAELEKEVLRQPYAPRAADPALSTVRLQSGLASARPTTASSSSSVGAALGPDATLARVERDVNSLTAAQVTRDYSDFRSD